MTGGGAGSTQYTQLDPIMNGSNRYSKNYHYGNEMSGRPPLSAGYQDDDDLTDVFQGLSLKEPPGIGYRRSSNMLASMNRRSSVPTQPGMISWPNSISEEDDSILPMGGGGGGGGQASKFLGLWPTSSAPHLTNVSTTNVIQTHSSSSSQPGGGGAGATPGSIWSPTFGSRPESELSSYHDSDSSNNGFSPIYSPVTVTTTGLFEPPLLHNGGPYQSTVPSSSVMTESLVSLITCVCVLITYILAHNNVVNIVTLTSLFLIYTMRFKTECAMNEQLNTPQSPKGALMLVNLRNTL